MRQPRTTGKLQTEERKVREVVRGLEREGWTVEADVRGRSQPDSIGDVVPDIVATKDGRRLLIEVKTLESVRKHQSALEALAEYATERDDTELRLVLTRQRKTPKKSVTS